MRDANTGAGALSSLLRNLRGAPRVEAIERDYPRIAERIAALWGAPELDTYFMDLMLDSRGDRQGFSPAVMMDILALSDFHALCRSRLGESDAPGGWGSPGARGRDW